MTKTRLAQEKSSFETFPIINELDPNVVVPADVQASIGRAAAALAQTRQDNPVGASNALPPDFRTAVTGKEVQEARDRYLDSLEAAGKGKRQQPRMIGRLRVTDVLVQREIADGTPMAVGPNSKMNRKIRQKLNSIAARTKDDRKSRRKQIKEGAVRALLQQVKSLRDATGD